MMNEIGCKTSEKFICRLCPRMCGVDRKIKTGFCSCSEKIKLARASLHFWEEPVLSDNGGAGAVFFSGCNLKCVYCQNCDISFDCYGKEVSVERLTEIYDELIYQGAECIDLVTPTMYTPDVIRSIDLWNEKHAGDDEKTPFCWNSSAYERVEVLHSLRGKVQIYLPDFKYMRTDIAKKYSGAPDYPGVAKKAILEMFDQVGPYRVDEFGSMKSGVIIRHLMLPGELENTLDVIDWVSSAFKPGDVLFSLMSQYTPNKFCINGGLSNRISEDEYNRAVDYMYLCGIEDGFVQDFSSAMKEYTPEFDLSGI